MKLLMVSGDRSMLQGKKGAFYYTLEEMSKHWERIDVIVPKVLSAKCQVPKNEETKNDQTKNFFGNVYFHPSPWSLWWQASWIERKGKDLINREQHNVMTVHEYPPFYNGRGALKLHQMTDIPYMTEIHHIVGYPKAASLQELIGRIWSRWWLPGKGTREAAVVRVVNNDMYALLQKWGVPESKIVELMSFYLDVSALIIDPKIHKNYDIVFCARLVANKGLTELLYALKNLPDTTLLVIGDGPEKERCMHVAAKLGLTNRVTFSGWLATNADVYRAIQSGKIFVMNSKSEGGPRVAFEAMALGMPIVSTRVGQVKHVIIDGTSGLFTTGDEMDLSEKVQRLLKDVHLMDELGKNAQVVRGAYSRSTQIEAYADALKDIARP